MDRPHTSNRFANGNKRGVRLMAFARPRHPASAHNATVCYLLGTTGWVPTFGGRPSMLWNPQVQLSDARFGVWTNRFGFTLAGPSNLVVVVEACTNLANPA